MCPEVLLKVDLLNGEAIMSVPLHGSNFDDPFISAAELQARSGIYLM